MMKKITLTTLFLFFLCFITSGKVYYTSPKGKETDLNKVTRDNPADWRAITQGEMARQLQCGDSVLLRWDQGIYTEGTRIYATGCSDTYEGAIHYMSEPGGFAVFRIEKYPQNNFRHIDRNMNPNGIVVGGEVHWKTSNRSNPVSGWNTRDPNKSDIGRYVWIREIVMQGNYGKSSPRRDLSSMKIPYGSTGDRAPGTIAGGKNYDDMTGFISLQAYGGRIINCVFWNLGHSGIGVNSRMRQGNATFYGNIITNTGHSSPERDRFHSVYQQWGSFNKGRLIHKHSIIQFSAEEQLQLWAQSGVDKTTGESKVDHIDLIENVLINGGTLSGKKHPNRIAPNAKIGGYTYDTDIRIIGNISWHDKGGQSWQSGYSLNSNNDRRNLYVKNNFLVGNGALFRNVSSIKEVSGNTFVALKGTQLDFQVTSNIEKSMLPHASKWNNNSFYGGGRVHYSKWVRDHVRQSYDKISFSDWQKKGFDKSSTYTQEYPNDMVKYFSNEYLEYYDSDWRGHVVILNFSRQHKKQIDISKFGLNDGDKFRIIDVQNVAGDLKGKYLYEGTYDAGNGYVEVDMIDHNGNNVVKDPTGEMVGPFGTDKRFGTYLVIRTGKAAPKPNQTPVAKAGDDQKITLPENTITIDGSASKDPDGTIVSYSCKKVSGPDSFKITNGDTNKPKVSELSEGTYTFKLIVTDNKGASDEDEIQVIVDPTPKENQAPSTSAGSDQTLTLPENSITLDGSGSFDEDGNIVSYQWEKISGPSPINMTGKNTKKLELSDLKLGDYRFKLTVTDDQKSSASDIVQLFVKPEKQQQQNQDDNGDSDPQQAQRIIDFTLINADTDQPISGYDPIPDGTTINLQDLPTRNLNIKANTDPYKVGSVMFSYGGKENYVTENLIPYAFKTDNNGDYRVWTPAVGNHTIKATPFSERLREGKKGIPATVSFIVIDEKPQEEEPVTEQQKVVSFTLINADSNQPIADYDPIPDGATINLYDLPTRNLNIRANTDPFKVGSVMFSYDGKENYVTENLIPYALKTDNNGDYRIWTPAVGNHTIKATPFSERLREGKKGIPATVSFIVIDEKPQEEEPVIEQQKVVSFTLINADSNQPIADYDPIPDGTTINLQDLPTRNLNIRANTDPFKVGSVMFSYDGKENYVTENLIPYALKTDNNGDYRIWTPAVGNHTIKATPFSERLREGKKGIPATVNFIVIDEKPQEEEPAAEQQKVVSFTLINADTDQPIADYDPIPEGSTINLYDLPTQNLNIRANTDPFTVGSVRFSYGGKENHVTENLIPYALQSDNNGDYNAWTPKVGNHTVKATPFSEKLGKGKKGLASTVNFKVINEMPREQQEEVEDPNQQKVVSFTLIDADKNKPIAGYDPIPEGSIINLQELPTLNLNIRANIAPDEVGSVRFSHNDNEPRTENKMPYALYSDQDGDYKKWTPALGNHSVTATPYSHTNERGDAGLPLTLNFTVDSYIPTNAFGAEKKYKIYPNPNKGVFDVEPADKDVKILSVAIYDTFGNKVYQKDYNKYFDVEHFALGLVKSGTYKIIFTTEKSIDHVTMIVEF